MEDIRIERLGAEGDGIAAGAFYPFTLPGERVRPGTPVEVLEPSEARVMPPCPHFGTCGGCSVQHASDPFLAEWKQDLVHRALAARGLTTPFGPTHVSPPRSRRRAVLTVRRTRKTVQIGFHERASRKVVDLSDCHVLRPGILALRPMLGALARLGASRNGPLKVLVTESTAGWDLHVTGGKALDGALRAALARAAGAVARLAWDGEVIAQRATPVQHIGRAAIVPPPGAFLQATADGAAALTAAVVAAVGKASKVADLFCGIGTFALPLAETADVLAVESDPEMIAALDAGWRQTQGLKTMTCEVRDLFRRPLVPAELDPFDALVFDPPRSGAAAQVAQLALSRIPKIVAVSCNPVSFARDAAILADGGYTLEGVQVVDQFRWTGHVELVATLTRTDASPDR